ncbi:MAG TPA: methyltransferase domain-containing protein [Terriglobia bacterium]|nr:methyltransferase domain-containing protein [Terriglobia bacterium]
MQSQQQAVQAQFTRTAEAFCRYATRDTPEMLAQRVEFAGLMPGDLVLDVACGPGAFTLAAAQRVRFARGADLTAAMLRQARAFQQERGVKNAFFDCAEAERLPYADGTFDFVTCQFAFHHMPRPQATLREMVRVAKPGGRIYLVDSVGPEDAAAAELHNHIEKLRDPSHTDTLSSKTFLAMFVSQKLRVLKQLVLDRPRSFNQWMLRAGHQTSDASYLAVRRALEDSMASDRAGFAARAAGDDIRIIHREGLFLLAKTAARLA